MDRIVSAVRPDGTVEYIDLTHRRRLQAAYDALGPKSRALIDQSPIDIDVLLLVQAFRERRRPLLDPDDPKFVPPAPVDDQMADFISDAIRRKVPGFEPITRRHRRG